MGREALVGVRIGSAEGRVKALLESAVLILRGDPALRRQWPLAALQRVQAEGEALCFDAGGERVALALGAKEAAAWARRIATPPPSLAAKLGVSAERPAFVCGPVDDAALAAHAGMAAPHAWLVYPKGRAANPGDAAIRSAWRAAGCMDSKSCAVSDTLTATRYTRR